MSFRATKKGDNNTVLNIDLNKLFDAEVPDNTKFRQAVGQEIIDIIIERTKKQKYLNAGADGEYSEEYVDSIEFQAFGKNKNKVNLTQSGDMLNLLDVVKETPGAIQLGWTDGLNQKKAANHNGGIGEHTPKREFLGLTGKEEDKIKKIFKPQLDDIRSEIESASSVSRLQQFITGELKVRPSQDRDSVLRTLFGDLELEDLDAET